MRPKRAGLDIGPSGYCMVSLVCLSLDSLHMKRNLAGIYISFSYVAQAHVLGEFEVPVTWELVLKYMDASIKGDRNS